MCHYFTVSSSWSFSFYMGHYFIAVLIILTIEIVWFRFVIINQKKKL